MITYVLDTNILSFAIRNINGIRERMIQETGAGSRLIITSITLFEVMRGLLAVNSQKRMILLELFWKQYGESILDEQIFRTAAKIYVDLRKIGKPIEDADLFIAAFCLINDYTFVTNNSKHFKNIDKLKMTDWSVI